MKRKLKWLTIVLAVLLLAFGTALFLWPRDRITAESWKMIQIGMTEKDVEEILEGPGINDKEYEALRDQLVIREVKGPVLWEPKWSIRDQTMTKFWVGQRGIIGIEFDQDRNVKSKILQPLTTEPNFIDRLRDWLGW